MSHVAIWLELILDFMKTFDYQKASLRSAVFQPEG
jgi:hypothetical protein